MSARFAVIPVWYTEAHTNQANKLGCLIDPLVKKKIMIDCDFLSAGFTKSTPTDALRLPVNLNATCQSNLPTGVHFRRGDSCGSAAPHIVPYHHCVETERKSPFHAFSNLLGDRRLLNLTVLRLSEVSGPPSWLVC